MASKTDFDCSIDAAVLAGFLLQEARAQHRYERQRDEHGDQDRRRHGEREFTKQAPDDAAHEQKRDEDRDQGHADRQNREGDLARSSERRLEWRAAALQVAMDVLDDDDDVVDHEADSDGESHQ